MIRLATNRENGEKLKLPSKYFWNIETLAILFSATEKVQKPFLNNAIKYFIDNETKDISIDKLIIGIGSAFYNVFKCNNNPQSLLLLNKVIDNIEEITNKKRGELWPTNIIDIISLQWHSSCHTYYDASTKDNYVNRKTEEELKLYKKVFQEHLKTAFATDEVRGNVAINHKIIISVICQLIYCLSYNTVQYDFIAPLLSRIESQSAIINRIFEISDAGDNSNAILTVVSLRDCNTTAKKLIPLLLTNYLYDLQKAL